MQRQISGRASQIAAIVVLGMFASGPVLAKAPGQSEQGHGNAGKHTEKGQSGKGHGNAGKSGNQGRVEQHQSGDNRGDRRTEHRFDDRQRQTVFTYYESEIRRGNCPPGLAKKQNGCVPPGLAKRYVIGQPLARDIIFYEVPRPVLVHLGAAPSGYRYVRVSNDILLLNRVTGIVVDALQNLGITG